MLLASCSVSISDSKNEIEEENAVDEERYDGVISNWYVDWGDDSCDIADFSIDEDLAIEIGNAIIKSAFGNNAITETRYIVREVIEKDCFVVTRLPKADIAGGDYSVAIKKNGEILKIWWGE